MPVQNLQPGNVMNVAANQIQGTAHVYRTGQGYNGAGNVGWQPNGGALQIQAINVGQTVNFAVNGQAGMIANGAPSMVQVLWDNGAALEHAPVLENEAARVLRRASTMAFAAGDDNSEAAQAMATLTAQWYNAIVTGCHLDPATFQLVQGNSPLGSTSEALWNIFDAVPPLSISNLYNPSQGNVFSTDYGAVIANLNPQNAGSFQSAMGDYYGQWVSYLNTSPTIPQGGILALFQNWSALHMPPDQAQAAYTAYQQVSQGVVPVAMQMWLAAGGGTGGTKAYNATITQLQNALAAAPGASVTLNSASASSDISHTWAKAEVGGWFDIFGGAAQSEYEQLTMSLIDSGLTIEASFTRLVTFSSGPLARPSTDPILSQYQPWYSSAALNLAYQNNNNVVWKHTPPTWDNTFGPGGNMLRTASALVVVDGIEIKTTSNASFDASSQTSFKAAAEAGIFPFFEASGSGGWTHDVSFDSSGRVTVNSSAPTGNPNILGVIVTPIGGVMLT
ncbi:MAG: hypothetical protein AB7I38_07770 [Dehalococcoidia bacterium]